MAEGATPTNGAHGREEHMPAMNQPPSSSTNNLGKVIQACDEEHDRAASPTKLIPKGNTDNMTHIDVDGPLKSTPVPKRKGPPNILSDVNDTRDHSSSRDEGRQHDSRASNHGHDGSTHSRESSTTRSTGVVRDGITSRWAAELAKSTAAASPSTKSVIPDALGIEKHMLAVLRPPSSWTKSCGKAIEAYNQEHDETVSSTKIIPKADADAGPSVRAPAQHRDGVIAVIAAHPAPAPPVPVLPPNPGVNYIVEGWMNSLIRPLRNPADGDEGKIWDKLN